MGFGRVLVELVVGVVMRDFQAAVAVLATCGRGARRGVRDKERRTLPTLPSEISVLMGGGRRRQGGTNLRGHEALWP